MLTVWWVLFVGGASTLTHATEHEVQVVAVGDVGFRRQVGVAVARGESDPFASVRQILSSADVTFANLETVLSVRPLPEPSTSRRFPIIKSPPQGAIALARAGFDVVSVANNHAFDFFAPGFADTLDALSHAGVTAIGGGLNPAAAAAPYIHEVNGVRIGVLAFASGVNRAAHGNAYVARRWGDAPLRAVRALRSQVDVVIVSVHWGLEGMNIPGPKQTQCAHALIDAGADVIIGHHPHVLQSVEIYRERPIFYSLGNFLFGKQPRVRRQSAILSLRLGIGAMPIREASLRPVLIHEEREVPELADITEAMAIVERMKKISRSFGTTWKEHDGMLDLLGPWQKTAPQERKNEPH